MLLRNDWVQACLRLKVRFENEEKKLNRFCFLRALHAQEDSIKTSSKANSSLSTNKRGGDTRQPNNPTGDNPTKQRQGCASTQPRPGKKALKKVRHGAFRNTGQPATNNHPLQGPPTNRLPRRQFDRRNEIKFLFKKLAIIFHPDMPNGNISIFQIITECHDKDILTPMLDIILHHKLCPTSLLKPSRHNRMVLEEIQMYEQNIRGILLNKHYQWGLRQYAS